ncbi:NRDE family protein [Virgibacillus sp. DJP39]|uniref:NRDE family protein n=1 Tax=Virgibacillus sp. DJP39 TaxID=3409790 RepID=UPI003BB59B9D
MEKRGLLIMCLINFQLNNHPKYKLIVAANRDEFYNRPTATAQFWKDNPKILAGRDLLQMGTWLGITKQGRFAALTNFRDPAEKTTGKVSRGDIVKSYLEEDDTPVDFLEKLKRNKDKYAGFNVLVGNFEKLFYYSNNQNEIMEIKAGTHGLSNHFLNTPWPKVEKGKKMLREYVNGQNEVQPEKLFNIISDTETASDDRLPQTGIDLELERKLSSQFITSPNYGTRSSTVLLVDQDNQVTFVERTYEGGKFLKDSRFEFRVG